MKGDGQVDGLRRPAPFKLGPYRLGDAVAFAPVEAIEPERLAAFARRMPRGEAVTARDDKGRPVAVMGVFEERGGWRCWALVSKEIGLSGWGHLLRMALIVLQCAAGQIVRAHAASRREERVMEALGFIPAPGGCAYPLEMVRFR